jgi:hypothetical protein
MIKEFTNILKTQYESKFSNLFTSTLLLGILSFNWKGILNIFYQYESYDAVVKIITELSIWKGVLLGISMYVIYQSLSVISTALDTSVTNLKIGIKNRPQIEKLRSNKEIVARIKTYLEKMSIFDNNNTSLTSGQFSKGACNIYVTEIKGVGAKIKYDLDYLIKEETIKLS